MNIRQQLNMRMSQNLVMTQSLQQAIKLLQLNKVELENLINKELEENPVLEEETHDGAMTERERRKKEKEGKTDELKADEGLSEVELDYFFDDYIEYQNVRGTRDYNVELPTFENTASQPTNLTDHLQWQADLSIVDEEDREIAAAIFGNLNNDGYLRASLEEIAEMIGCDVDIVEEIHQEIMRFDPVGVAARDVRECLLVQLDNLDSGNLETAREMVSKHLGYLEKRAYQELAKEMGVSLSAIQQSLEVIKSLDPKPGSKFNASSNSFVEPDVFILKEGDEYVIMLNDDDLPKLRINQSYQKMMKKKSGEEEETRNFIRDRVNSAKWLLKSFVQRQHTILKVVESIVKRQRDFLEKGVEHLKPMVLSDVAMDIEMHESTVSRVVTNKYVHTPRGVFELKYFFSSGIRSTGGEDISSLAVKNKIKQIVENEDSRKPLSDSKIMAMLHKDGLKIARRTIAKYREELNIPPSKMRKSVF